MPSKEDLDKWWKNVFRGEQGRKVLGDILTRGHFGETLDADNPVQIAEYNFAMVIAYKAGLLEILCRQAGVEFDKGERNDGIHNEL